MNHALDQSADFDCVCFLMIAGWETELRSNRWHFARRWSRHRPVLLVQPTLAGWTPEATLEPEPRIPNCEILRIAIAGQDPQMRLVETATQLAQLLAGLRHRGYRRPLLWLYNPCLAALYTAMPAAARVMHCTEAWFDFAEKTDDFRDQVRLAVRASDLVVAVSLGVEASVRRHVPEANLQTVTNGCDFAAYSSSSADADLLQAGQGFQRIAVCAANIDRRVDYRLLGSVAGQYPQTLFALFGRLGALSADGEAERAQAFGEPNVRYLGLAEPDRLPGIYAAASLGFIPYGTSPMLVESGFSLKALEMAAGGLPVVSSLMRPLRGLASGLHVAADAEDFCRAIGQLDRAQLSPSRRNELIAAARANDYDAKFGSIVELMDQHVPRGRPLAHRLDCMAACCPAAEIIHPWQQAYTRWWLADERNYPSDLAVPVLAADAWSAQCYADHAAAYGRQGRFDLAQHLAGQAIALRSEAGGHCADVSLWLEHARAGRELGDLPSAEKSLGQARKILAEPTEAAPRLLGEVLLEQGALARLAERWADAEPLLRAAVGELAPLAECLPRYSQSLYELGATLCGAGRDDEAVGPLEQALSYRPQLGSACPDVMSAAAFELGCLYKRLRRWDDAAVCLRQAADLQIALTGPEHWAVAMVFVEQGLTCESLGRLPAATEFFAQAVEIQRRHYGEDHPTVQQNRVRWGGNLLARARQARGENQPDSAAMLFQQALEPLAKTDADKLTAPAHFELALLLRELGQAGAAIEHFDQAARLQGRLVGPNHWVVAAVLVEHAVTYREMQQWCEAAALLERAVDLQVLHFGNQDTVTHNSRTMLGQVLFDQGKCAQAASRTDEAAALFRRAIEHLRTSAPGSPYLATACYELGCALRAGNALREAETSLAEALELAVGEELAKLRINVLCELAASLRSRGEFFEAIARFAEASELQRCQLGSEHWMVGLLLIEQALTWEPAGNLAAAVELLDQALPLYSAHFGVEHQTTINVRDKRQNLATRLSRPRWLQRLVDLRAALKG